MKAALKLKDCQMREIVFDYFESQGSKLRILEEFCITHKTRTDAFVVTEDRFIGIEFKSDRDNLDRLEHQIKDYQRFCDENYIVIGAYFNSRLSKLKEILPEYWGIFVVYIDEDDKLTKLKLLREAKKSPKCRLKNQLHLLWRSELITLVRQNHLGGVTAYNKMQLGDKLFHGVDREQLKKMICNQLLERDYTIYSDNKQIEN